MYDGEIMKIRFILCVLVLGSIVQAASKPSAKVVAKDKAPAPVKKNIEAVDPIKNCLQVIFKKQMAYRDANARYIDTLTDLELQKMNECRKADITIDTVSKTDFKIRAVSKDSAWTVDQNRTFIKEK